MLDFAYEDTTRAQISVDSRAIVTALRSIYAAPALARELTGRD